MSASAALTSPPVLMRRRAIAIATFSLPWKYLLAVSEDIVIRTFGSQSTSSVHSQCRLPSSPSRRGADVDDHVDVGELEALRDVRVPQLRPHLGVGVHHPEDPVHDLAELLRRAELGWTSRRSSAVARLSYSFFGRRAPPRPRTASAWPACAWRAAAPRLRRRRPPRARRRALEPGDPSRSDRARPRSAGAARRAPRVRARRPGRARRAVRGALARHARLLGRGHRLRGGDARARPRTRRRGLVLGALVRRSRPSRQIYRPPYPAPAMDHLLPDRAARRAGAAARRPRPALALTHVLYDARRGCSTTTAGCGATPASRSTGRR